MASTFELSSQYYGTRHLRLACSQTTDIATNTSTIAWTLYSEGGSSDYYTTGPTTVKINGTTVYYKDTVYYNEGIFPAKKGSVSGTTTVQHNNDGTKSITVSLTTAIYYSSTETKSGTWTLDSIPRYATLSTSLSSKTETAVTMSWTADATCDRLYYSTNNGSTFSQVTIADSTSGTYTITGLSANTAYNIKTKVRRKDSQLETTSTAVSVTTYAYPYATTMPDFTIGNQVQVTIYNPLSRSCSVQLQTNGGTAVGSISTSTTTAKGWNSSANQTTLYASIPNATYANYKVAVTYSGHTETRTGGKYNINTTACTPTIGSVTYQDTNTASVNVTQDNQKIVQNQSIVRYTASSLSAKNSATISSVSVAVNGSTYNMTISGTTATGGNATINSSSNVTATVTITDSRGLTGTKSVTVSIYEWKLPTGIITMQRQNNYYTPTSIKCDAQYSYLGGHNTISISYAGTKDGDSTATVTGTLQDNVAQTINFDNEYGWTVRYTLTDAFGTTTYNVRLDRGEPIVYFDRLKTSVGFGTFPKFNKEVKLPDASTIDNGWRMSVGGKYSTYAYMPYSFVAVGQSNVDGYARIATIKVTGTWNYSLYHFKIMRIYDAVPVNVYLCFSGANTSDPAIARFIYDESYGASSNFSVFAYKTETSTWDIYVKKYSASDAITVTTQVSYFQQARSTITYSDNLLTSVPSGAIVATAYGYKLLTGTCTTAGATADKVATVNGGMYFPLVNGTTVVLYFNSTNTASVANVTLNVNNTGAKHVVKLRNGNREYMSSYDSIRAGAGLMFTYSDGYWWLMNSDSDHVYVAMSQSEANTGTATTARSITAQVLDAKIANKVGDYIVSRGTSGIWTYEKWNSGKAICWGRQAISKSGAWVNWSGGIYLDSWAGTSYSFPSGLFNAVPTFTMTMESSSYMWASPYGATTKTTTPAIVFMRPGGASSFSATLNMHAIGTWK